MHFNLKIKLIKLIKLYQDLFLRLFQKSFRKKSEFRILRVWCVCCVKQVASTAVKKSKVVRTETHAIFFVLKYNCSSFNVVNRKTQKTKKIILELEVLLSFVKRGFIKQYLIFFGKQF